ncbi:ABC transporter substrate-binding protein [Erythrobacter sp. GH3-10]|uniref:ABC transporter substrate-binding protein n=2 Tax=Aurantiacibacter rhizosphaerae TaxID=2691582 RepID=A0A844XF43_9SPHN|nr:ABC transporter substrate-binding protein [Aurantiacibacter rhizosphaerae]MWV28373.1 ABC transporter substrate-binding protein [Aurantiacibacter rhizosphaerae]
MVLTACSGSQPESIASGQPTIVSLNPCADAILAEIAAPGQLLAISHYSHDPAASSMLAAEAARFATTGGTAEEVLALAPDMVVADAYIPPATRRALEQAGIVVESVGMAGSLEDSLAQIEALGAVTGNAPRADALSRQIAESWAAHRWDGRPVSALLWQQGGIVPGETSLAHKLLAQAGFASHSAARGMGQGAYLPLERVLADPPQVVIATAKERAADHPAMDMASDTVRFELDPTLLYCGGPTIPRALERLGEIRRAVG